ncbi:hypothetical protein C2869_08160 [Saccharobesus litoralis]|uniref:Porin n=1 Tax=Saccharobesus litoralis TaxID=2172099 RepID=A0A2S0VQA7_9ALTE|nr:porin [Saccharobesus litoralis]AWB66403.1 hypothetical protein C2869_08160 [Saccharobesus litoralis]
MRLLIGLICLTCLPVLAEDLRVSGFGTLGFTVHDSEHYGLRNDISAADGSFKDEVDFASNSILGLQLDYDFNANLSAVSQFTYHNQNSFSLDNYISQAYLRYKPTANWTIRVGRTPLDLFLLTEYRDIGFAYPWAHVPSEVYGILPFRYVDGADVSYTIPVGQLNFTAKIFTGSSESEFSNYQFPERVKTTSLSGLSLELNDYDWLITIKHSQGKFDDNIASVDELIAGFDFIPISLWPNKQDFIPQLNLVDSKSSYTSIGGRYDATPITLMAEFAKVNGDRIMVRDLLNGYLSLAYEWSQHLVFSYFAFTNADRYDIANSGLQTALLPAELSPLASALDAAINYFASNQDTTAIGWRYHLNERTALKIQWDHTKIDENGATLWINKTRFSSVPADTINTLSANLSFTF